MKLLTPQEQTALATQIIKYVKKTLHVSATLVTSEAPANLPVFLGRSYCFFEGKIAEGQCLVMIPKDEPATPADTAKHVNRVQTETGKNVILGLAALSARDRARLIAHKVAFIVPGNQFYVPELGMDLREHFRGEKYRAAEGLSPAAQAVLFHHILRRNDTAITPSQLATDLHYSAMSIGRAFDDLVVNGLAETEKHGRERHLRFLDSRWEILERARLLLRSPVRSRKVIWGPFPQLALGGESALAKLTELSPPKQTVFVMLANQWKDFAANREHADDLDAAEFIVETWSYNPVGLSDTDTVDPLSLYAQFWNHDDERVATAAEQLLERVSW